MLTSTGIIDALKLTPHPEGGYFKEVYRSKGVIKKDSLDFITHGDRNYSTSIYFLLEQADYSAFHRIKPVSYTHLTLPPNC